MMECAAKGVNEISVEPRGVDPGAAYCVSNLEVVAGTTYGPPDRTNGAGHKLWVKK